MKITGLLIVVKKKHTVQNKNKKMHYSKKIE